VVQWFWELVRSYEHEQKAKLLQFVTGTSGVPIQGFAYLQVRWCCGCVGGVVLVVCLGLCCVVVGV